MSDNIPSTIIRNIPPFIKVQKGNNGSTFTLPPSIFLYSTNYLAQEIDISTSIPNLTLNAPIELEDGENILV